MNNEKIEIKDLMAFHSLPIQMIMIALIENLKYQKNFIPKEIYTYYLVATKNSLISQIEKLELEEAINGNI